MDFEEVFTASYVGKGKKKTLICRYGILLTESQGVLFEVGVITLYNS